MYNMYISNMSQLSSKGKRITNFYENFKLYPSIDKYKSYLIKTRILFKLPNKTLLKLINIKTHKIYIHYKYIKLMNERIINRHALIYTNIDLMYYLLA